MLDGIGETPYSVCPYCHVSLGSHFKTFGPDKAICFNCGKTSQTGRLPWSELSLVRKLGACLRETFAPTDAYASPMEGCMHFALMFWLLIPLDMWRLVRSIGESNEYSRTGEPPVWSGKASPYFGKATIQTGGSGEKTSAR